MKKLLIVVAMIVVASISVGVFMHSSNTSTLDETASGSLVQIDLAGVVPVDFLVSFKVDPASIKNGEQGTITWVKSGSLLEKKGVKKGDVILNLSNGNGILKIRSF